MKLIQFKVEDILHEKLEKGAESRGTKKINVLCRMTLMELDRKGYFDDPRNELKVIKHERGGGK